MVAVGKSIRVLVIEDEESYRQGLASGLGREGFEVEVAPDGAEGPRLFTDHPPDIVLLDMLLPGMHGIEVCRRMRAIAPVPIVMLSAVDSQLDVVLGFELGLPAMSPNRSGCVSWWPGCTPSSAGCPHASIPWTCPDGRPGGRPPGGPRRAAPRGRLRIGRRRLRTPRGNRGRPADPPLPTRFDLLAVLLTPARRVRTHDELIDLLWPDRYLSDSRTLDTHIHRLRAKLEPDPADPQFIVTVRGVGFRIDPDGTRVAASSSAPSCCLRPARLSRSDR